MSLPKAIYRVEQPRTVDPAPQKAKGDNTLPEKPCVLLKGAKAISYILSFQHLLPANFTLGLGLSCYLNENSWSLLKNHPQFTHSPLLLTLPAFPLIISCVKEHLLELDLITLLVLLLSLQSLSLFTTLRTLPSNPLYFILVTADTYFLDMTTFKLPRNIFKRKIG